MAWKSLRKVTVDATSALDHLIWDEYLLKACDAGMLGPSLRFWTIKQPAVILGYSNRVDREVRPEVCREHAIPIIRRSTGGGAVYLDAGCLNYSLILPLNYHASLVSVGSTNLFVMEQHQQAFQKYLDCRVDLKGDTDLVWEGCKISGNAQRRMRSALLFHGSFLCAADISIMEQVLRPPTRQPAYRNGKPHRQFVQNLEIDAERLQQAMLSQWVTDSEVAPIMPLIPSLWEQSRGRIRCESGPE